MSDAPVPVGRQLGLSEHWQPAQSGWRFGGVTMSDGHKLHVLIFETVAGSFGVALNDDDLRNLGQQCVELATGIEIARPGQFPGNGFGPPA